jgi:hypothetical protein
MHVEVGAGTQTAKKPAICLKLLQRALIGWRRMRLIDDRSIPLQAVIGKRGEDVLHAARDRSRRINVIYAKMPRAAISPRV